MAPRTTKDDAGQADVQKTVNKAEEKGYLGTKVDPLPNSAHSLESGPEAPAVHDAQLRRDIADVGEED
jgi:hypothetical protein